LNRQKEMFCRETTWRQRQEQIYAYGKLKRSLYACNSIAKDAERDALLQYFYGGGQNRLTEVGKPTASEQRSRLIVAFTEAVGQPPRLIT
jgi:hypothetical protein